MIEKAGRVVRDIPIQVKLLIEVEDELVAQAGTVRWIGVYRSARRHIQSRERPWRYRPGQSRLSHEWLIFEQ